MPLPTSASPRSERARPPSTTRPSTWCGWSRAGSPRCGCTTGTTAPSTSSGADHVSTIVLNHTAEIVAPAPLAWQVLADYSRDVEWRHGVLRMVPTPDGAAQVGTTTAEELKVAGRTYRNDGEVTAV